MPEIVQQYRDNGDHRLVVDGVPGEWANYTHPAHFEMGSVAYVALTDYHEMESGVFECYTVKDVKIQPVCTVCEKPYEHAKRQDTELPMIKLIKRSSACVHIIANFPLCLANEE